MDLDDNSDDKSVVVCSIGDAAITEGEVAEALQMAVLKKLPILYLVQDNEWDISRADEIRAMDASEYGKVLKGLKYSRLTAQTSLNHSLLFRKQLIRFEKNVDLLWYMQKFHC